MKDLEFRLSARFLRRLSVAALIGAFMIPTAVIAAGGAFTDDDTSVFEANIEWLADSGVTKGCNPPDNTRFCPDDNVTRGQMAAFMQRFAQYLGAEDGTPAVADTALSADTLDGYAPSDLVRAAYAEETTSIDDFAGTDTDLISTTVTAPIDGIFMVTANLIAEWDVSSTAATNADLQWQVTVDGTEYGVIVDQEFADTTNGSNSGESMTSTVAVPVTAGEHTITIRASRSGTSMIFIKDRSISTLFVPFGSGGELGVLGAVGTERTTTGSVND